MQEYNSMNSSINKYKVPKLFKQIEWLPGKINVDIGGGKYDTATEYLSDLGVRNYILDPFNRTKEHNSEVQKLIRCEVVDSVTLSNVLNVIKEDEEVKRVLKEAKDYLKEGGKIYIGCHKSKRKGLSRNNNWQRAIDLKEYKCFIELYFKEVKIIKGHIEGTK